MHNSTFVTFFPNSSTKNWEEEGEHSQFG